MIFQERKLDDGCTFTYFVEDLFGTIEITSKTQLKANSLDAIVSGILQSNTTVGNVTPDITFVWNRKPQWLAEDEGKKPGLELTIECSKKSRGVALAFCLIFGALGIHRFYVGRNKTAVLMLVLSLSLVGLIVVGIAVIFDFIVIAAGMFHDAEGKRLANW